MKHLLFPCAASVAVLLGSFAMLAHAQKEVPKDDFYWLGEINKASTVMVVEQNIVPLPLGTKIAASVDRVIDDGAKPGAPRSGDYLDIEKSMIAVGGPDVTRIHSGRSRQDIAATFGRLFLRDDVLNTLESMAVARRTMLDMAAAHPDSIVPAYTWGVQAQPISFGHYMLAYAEALGRAAERLKEGYARVNLSPLGAAALGTSSFPVNRPRLAELLGFDGVLENSFDANQLSEADTRAEIDQMTATGALTVSMLLADITQQYAQSRPWLILQEGQETGVSSIMPQKRNPSAMVYLRGEASDVVSAAASYQLRAHNVASGMMDYKLFKDHDPVLSDASKMYLELSKLLQAFHFDEARALDEVSGEYSTTTELADTLQRVGDVPFRVGHHFASELTTFGRAHGYKPSEIPFADAQRIYAESAASFGINNAQLPIDEALFRRSLSPQGMVQASQGLGGPQPAEVQRMLTVQRKALADDDVWTRAARDRLRASDVKRQAAFDRIAHP